MKHILIVSHAMELGGAERSLLGLLENIDYSANHVDLFLLRHQGDLMCYIPAEVNLLPENPSYCCLAVPIKEVLKKGKINIAFCRFLGKISASRRIKELNICSENAIGLEYSHKYTKACMPLICDIEYDLAISFLTPHYFVRDKVRAKKKIAWIHTDYSKVAIDRDSELYMWEAFDDIVAVSEGVRNQFIMIFPSLKDKVTVIENILPTQIIKRQAEERFALPYSKENINLLSIGRFSYAKNFDNIPEICKKIKKRIPNIKWYIIGYGKDEVLIRQKIREFEMENTVIVLGKKDNPYPYIMSCDLYVQPSRFEGKAVTVKEAQMLGKPVVITAYGTSGSQLTDGVDGIIVPMDNEGCADGIIELLCDYEKMGWLASNCKQESHLNMSEISMVERLIEK